MRIVALAVLALLAAGCGDDTSSDPALLSDRLELAFEFEMPAPGESATFRFEIPRRLALGDLPSVRVDTFEIPADGSLPLSPVGCTDDGHVPSEASSAFTSTSEGLIATLTISASPEIFTPAEDPTGCHSLFFPGGLYPARLSFGGD